METSSGVGLVIPTYNRADLIAETLESALKQVVPFETIIVVDNGSTDETESVVAQFGTRVRYLKVPNVGVQAARNLGADSLATPWIALCDSDDILCPRYVQSGVEAICSLPEADAWACNFENFEGLRVWPDKFSQAPLGWFDGARRTGRFIHDVPGLLERNLHFQPIFPTGLMIRAQTYKRLCGYNPAFRGIGAEDWEFALRTIARSRVAFNTEVVARIRRHPGNDSANGLRMLLGECEILKHAMRTMPEFEPLEVPATAALERRLAMAFDAAFARGDFALAHDINRQQLRPARGSRQLLKRCILGLPDRTRAATWRWTQGSDQMAEAPRRISVVEPAWTGMAHLPGNIGFVDFVLSAFPQADVTFIGDTEQIERMRSAIDINKTGRLRFHAWECQSDDLPGPGLVWGAWRRWQALPRVLTEGADKILLTSVTPTALRCLQFMGLADRAAGMLHGNAVELGGWRSRNPLRRGLDLTSSLKAFVRAGGLALVLEHRIQAQLTKQMPWLEQRVRVLPHPISPREARPQLTITHESGNPIRIGYAGMATRAKGFPEFLSLARRVHQICPGRFEFHAIGMLHPSLSEEDQSCLTVPAGLPLDRDVFVERVRALDYMFVWHSDEYYGSAASGVVYDAVNQLVPLLARRSAQIAEWESQGYSVGYSFETLDELIARIAGMTATDVKCVRKAQVESLTRIRDSLSAEALAKVLLQICSDLKERVHPQGHGPERQFNISWPTTSREK